MIPPPHTTANYRDMVGLVPLPAPSSSWLRRQDIPGILEDEGFACETFLDQLGSGPIEGLSRLGLE